VNGTLKRFKSLSFIEGQALLDVLATDYDVKLGGRKGNVHLYTYDRRFKVEIANQDRITFNAGIEVAKALFQEWLRDADASEEIKVIVGKAFELDDQKRLRAQEILRLSKYQIQHPTWHKAMRAVAEAMEVIGTREYMRFYERDVSGDYRMISVDFASVERAA